MDPNSVVTGSNISCPKHTRRVIKSTFWYQNSLVVLEERINELGMLLNLEVCARWLLEWSYSTLSDPKALISL